MILSGDEAVLTTEHFFWKNNQVQELNLAYVVRRETRIGYDFERFPFEQRYEAFKGASFHQAFADQVQSRYAILCIFHTIVATSTKRLMTRSPALRNNLGHLVYLSLRTSEGTKPLLRKLPRALVFAVAEKFDNSTFVWCKAT